MSEMIERVAAAIESEFTSNKEVTAETMARAAIAAMREPSETMLVAADTSEDDNPYPTPHFREAYRAMIDAALKDAP